jgi:hypothetical protein
MSKSLLALPLVAALVFVTMRATAAAPLPAVPDSPMPPTAMPTPPAGPTANPTNAVAKPPPPVPEQPRTYTMTLYIGNRVRRQTWVWENGSWHEDNCHVCVPDCRPVAPPCSSSRPRCREKPPCVWRHCS